MCSQVDSSVEDVVGEEAVSEDIKRLDLIKDILHENIMKQQESTKRSMKEGAAKPALKVGDKVWRQNVRSQQRKGGKLEPNFLALSLWWHCKAKVLIWWQKMVGFLKV